MSFHVDANQELSSRNEILARLNDAANDPGGKAKDEWKAAMEDTGNAVIARLSTRRRREPGQDELVDIPNDIQDRHLTKCFLFIQKPDNECYMTSPEANDPKQRRRKRKLQTRVDGGYKKKSGDDDLQYPILPDPDDPGPMDALVRDAYRPDGTVLTIDFREMDAFLILESHLNSIEDFPHDDYFVIELYVDLKSHLMEVIGEKNIIDGINGNCPQYYTRRYVYRKAVVGGREEYVPLCRQRGLDGQGQFAIFHKGTIRRMVQNGNGVPATTTDKYRIVVSFCMMMITSTVLLKVGPVNSQTDGAFIRYENGDCHDGHLIVASGIYHFRCFHARSLKIGSQAYVSFNRDVLGQWDPTAVAQQQQAPQPPAQPQQPPQQQAPQPAPAQPPQHQPPAQHQQLADGVDGDDNDGITSDADDTSESSKDGNERIDRLQKIAAQSSLVVPTLQKATMDKDGVVVPAAPEPVPAAMAEADDAFLRAFLDGRWLAVAAIPVAVAVEGLTMPNPPGPNMGHQTNRPQPN
eukprot:CAMPEP_0185807186 /NCGR_PEP_ID=MMETSP1322-20130828/4867_1 /TAXON_ID=265543 /ORGANISM="Minutocellus polymorphus, Strain RCC2270" /LENGTH=520 /DNA_ID=CAMNT_0028503311 /DNA_START=661 /DNA_END=2223 /DNA_ORIENTATION=-